MGQLGFWDFTARHQKLETKKDFLSNLDKLVPWETFRPLLEQVHHKPRKSNAGRLATDVMLMLEYSTKREMRRRISVYQ